MRKTVGVVLCLVSLSTQAESIDCNNAVTTFDINVCEGKKLKEAEVKLVQYLAKALEVIKEQKEAFSSLEKSQTAWEEYKDEYCDAVYENWSDGSIRGFMQISCLIKLTNQRTHNIWQDYLTYMDSSPPILPEPEK